MGSYQDCIIGSTAFPQEVFWMQRYDAVLFDVDGTLIHSRPGYFNCFAYAFRKWALTRIR